MRTRLYKRGARLGALTIALLAAAGGIAYATIPDANGVYTACKANATGTIRLIDPSLGESALLGHCTSLETQITWNQKGQAGPQGPAGLQGPKGDTGAQGPAGPAGPAGPKGDIGPQGPEGPKGDQGEVGAQGPAGNDGVSVTSTAVAAGDTNCPAGGSKFTSASGDTYACNGAQGQKGDTGPAGPAGPPGPLSGYQIVAGPTASVGAGNLGSQTVSCPFGKKALGGGFFNGIGGGLVVTRSTPTFLGGGWEIDVENKATITYQFSAVVVCANA